jgi:hypothetical protein
LPAPTCDSSAANADASKNFWIGEVASPFPPIFAQARPLAPNFAACAAYSSICLRGDAAAGLSGRAGEHGEAAVLHQVRHVHQLQRDAQVRLVRAIAAHGLGIGHARERIGQFHAGDLAEHVADHRLDRVLHVALGHPGELHVELGELELAVGAQRLVAEAARDLVVAVEARHHQDLLEQLRRLRQGVELAGVHARRDQEVARALGRGLGQDRGLDVLEAARIQPAAQRRDQLRAGAHLALHVRASQVEVAVPEADVLARVLVVVERQRIGLVQHLDALGHHFHLAGADPGVDRMAAAHGAGDAQAVLVAHLFGRGQDLGVAGRVRGLGHHLDDALMVAQVDEADPAEVAGDVGPAAQGHGLPDQRLVDQATEMATHASRNSRKAVGRQRRPENPRF